MAKFYIDSFIGVKDGTRSPAQRSDGRKVGVAKASIFGAKPAGVAWAIGDHVFLGTLRQGQTLRSINVNADASLGTTTLTVGNLNAADVNNAKYANARTMITPDLPTSIGPRATAADDGPLAAEEDVWMTIGVAGIGAGVNVSFELEVTALD